jgi:integrase
LVLVLACLPEHSPLTKEAAGTPVTTISKLLGHSSVAVTARYLDHLTNGQAVTRLESTELPPLGEPG